MVKYYQIYCIADKSAQCTCGDFNGLPSIDFFLYFIVYDYIISSAILEVEREGERERHRGVVVGKVR